MKGWNKVIMNNQNDSNTATVQSTGTETVTTKFCKHCGAKIPEDAVLCTFCGRQVEELKSSASQPNIIINNDNSSVNSNVNTNVNTNAARACPVGRPKNKWVALALCFFLGFAGAHKFYEGKTGMGILYLFTGGLCLIGTTIDFFALLFKPNPYYV